MPDAWRLRVARALLAASRSLTGTTRWAAPWAAGLCDEAAFVELVTHGWRSEEGYRHPSLLELDLLPFEKDIAALMSPRARVAVAGCGGGRDIIALAKRGYSVTGFDIAPSSVETARRALTERGISATVHRGDAADFVCPGGPFELFIFSWVAYGYIPGKPRRVKALRNALRALAPNGRILLPLKVRDSEALGRGWRLARLVANLTRNTFHLEPGDLLHEGFLYERRFSRDEIAGEAAAADLELERWDSFPDSHGVNRMAVLRKSSSQ